MRQSKYYKIKIAVPVKYADKIRRAVNDAGGSRQGNYDFSSGSYRTIGRFRPLAGAKPAIGSLGKIEEVEEEVIECLCHKDKLKKVIMAIKKAHPYEEPAIDIIQRFEV
jgi:hypothetical protein